MTLRHTTTYTTTALDATNEYTPMRFAKDFSKIVFTLVADNSASATVKFYSSNMEARPDLSAVASATNAYETVEVVALTDGTLLDGVTGVVYAGATDWVTRYEVNENGTNWVGAKMTARVAWDVTVKVDMYDNS